MLLLTNLQAPDVEALTAENLLMAMSVDRTHPAAGDHVHVEAFDLEPVRAAITATRP